MLTWWHLAPWTTWSFLTFFKCSLTSSNWHYSNDLTMAVVTSSLWWRSQQSLLQYLHKRVSTSRGYKLKLQIAVEVGFKKKWKGKNKEGSALDPIVGTCSLTILGSVLCFSREKPSGRKNTCQNKLQTLQSSGGNLIKPVVLFWVS